MGRAFRLGVNGHGVEEFLNNGVGRLPLRLGVVVEHDAVAQHGGPLWLRMSSDLDLRAAVERRAGLGCEDQRLPAARPDAPEHPVVDELGSRALRRPRRTDQRGQDVVQDSNRSPAPAQQCAAATAVPRPLTTGGRRPAAARRSSGGKSSSRRRRRDNGQKP